MTQNIKENNHLDWEKAFIKNDPNYALAKAQAIKDIKKHYKNKYIK